MHFSDCDPARNNRNQCQRDEGSEEESRHIVFELMPEIDAPSQFSKEQNVHDDDCYFLPEVEFVFHHCS